MVCTNFSNFDVVLRTWCNNDSQPPTQCGCVATWIWPLNPSSSKNIRAVSEIHLKVNLVEAPTIPVSSSVHGRYTRVSSPAGSLLWGWGRRLLLWSPIWPLWSEAASPSRSLLRGIPPTTASPWWCCVIIVNMISLFRWLCTLWCQFKSRDAFFWSCVFSCASPDPESTSLHPDQCVQVVLGL